MKLQFLMLCSLLSFNFLQGSEEKLVVKVPAELHNFIVNKAELEMEALKHSYHFHKTCRDADVAFLNTLGNQLDSVSDRDTRIATIRSVASSLVNHRWTENTPHYNASLYAAILHQITPRKYCCCTYDPSTKLSDENIRNNVTFLKNTIRTQKQRIRAANIGELLELRTKGIDDVKLVGGEVELRKIIEDID